MRWAYGVMTCQSRLKDLLPRTLASLERAGFDQPRLFIDGVVGYELPEFRSLEITVRYGPPVRTAGNWVLSLYELYARQPGAERYAIFQDDFVTYRNLRQYLEAVPFPTRGYLNLYTFRSNLGQFLPREDGSKIDGGLKVGWAQAGLVSHNRDNEFHYQTGRGAVALVFDLEGVKTLLTAKHLVGRFNNVKRGHRSIDGGIVTSMNEAYYREYVHHPSLTQHTGLLSSIGNQPHEPAPYFRGEDFNALDLLKNGS